MREGGCPSVSKSGKQCGYPFLHGVDVKRGSGVSTHQSGLPPETWRDDEYDAMVSQWVKAIQFAVRNSYWSLYSSLMEMGPASAIDYNKILAEPENPYNHTKVGSKCLMKVGDDEPIFVIRAQDESAASIVQMWLAANRQISPAKRDEALDCLRAMREWPKKKKAD